MPEAPSTYIKRLLSTNDIKDKKSIIREAVLDRCFQLFLGFQMAFDNTIIFNINKVPLIKGIFTNEEMEEDSKEFIWDDFIKLSIKLIKKQIPSSEISGKLHNIAEISCINEWNYFYRNILMKQMRFGISVNAINKILTEIGGDALRYIIPVWKVQHISKSCKNISGSKTLEPKLKGIRLITIIDVIKQTVIMYTTTGTICDKFNHITNHLIKLLPFLPESIMLDGQLINTQEYILFDMLFYDDFKNHYSNMTLLDRHDGLIELIPYLQTISNNDIQVLPKKKYNFDNMDISDLRMFYSDMLSQGYDTIVIKDINGLYEYKRSSVWIEQYINNKIIKNID